MKKRKITYSMTAQQKKQLKRQLESEKENNEEGDAAEENTVKEAPKKTGLIVSLVAGLLAVALITVAICLPVIASKETITNDTFLKWKTYNSKDPDHPYDDANPNPNPPANPIITFTLYSDDEAAFSAHFGAGEVKLNFELFIDDAPFSSINMLYLAESHFYDETIINDVKNGHAMFNGFTKAADRENKAFNLDFMQKLTGFDPKRVSQINNTDFKLGYRLNSETKRKEDDAFGCLIMLAGTSSSGGCSSTAFVMVTRDNSPQFDDLMSYQNNMSWMGKLTADDGANQREMLNKLNSVPTTKKGKFYVPNFNIKIKSVRSDLSSARRKYLLNNFESLIEDGLGSSWRSYAYSDSDYKFSD